MTLAVDRAVKPQHNTTSLSVPLLGQIAPSGLRIIKVIVVCKKKLVYLSEKENLI